MNRKIFVFLAVMFPTIAFAYSTNADDLLDYFMTVLRALSGMIGSFAIAFFFWSLIKFIKASNSGTVELSKYKDMLIYSAIALFLMVGIWSIVGYVQTSLGTDIVSSDITLTPLLPDSVD